MFFACRSSFLTTTTTTHVHVYLGDVRARMRAPLPFDNADGVRARASSADRRAASAGAEPVSPNHLRLVETVISRLRRPPCAARAAYADAVFFLSMKPRSSFCPLPRVSSCLSVKTNEEKSSHLYIWHQSERIAQTSSCKRRLL